MQWGSSVLGSCFLQGVGSSCSNTGLAGPAVFVCMLGVHAVDLAQVRSYKSLEPKRVLYVRLSRHFKQGLGTASCSAWWAAVADTARCHTVLCSAALMTQIRCFEVMVWCNFMHTASSVWQLVMHVPCCRPHHAHKQVATASGLGGSAPGGAGIPGTANLAVVCGCLIRPQTALALLNWAYLGSCVVTALNSRAGGVELDLNTAVGNECFT